MKSLQPNLSIGGRTAGLNDIHNGKINIANPGACAGIGAITGGVGMYYYFNPPMLFAPLKSREQSKKKDDDDREKQALVDEAICRSLNDPSGCDRCRASANERYGACRAGRPLPPLITW